MNGKTTQGLIARLDAGGYLASGRTRLSPVTTAEQITIKSQLYHNPLTSISGLVSTSAGYRYRNYAKIHGKH